MHNPKTQPDFVLFPSQPSDQTDMLAFEPSRHQHSPYFPQFSMEATLNDPFGFNMDNFSSFAQNEGAQRAPQSYLDTPSLYVESVSDMNKPMAFPPVPSTPPSISEQHMPSLSSVSGPSIASAPSSTIGSPYSGATHRLQEDWIDTNHGLGLPAEVVNDLFPNDYVGNAAYNEAVLGQDKLANNFVGECDNISSSVNSQSAVSFSNSQFSEKASSSSSSSSSSFPITSPDPEPGMAMDPILRHANVMATNPNDATLQLSRPGSSQSQSMGFSPPKASTFKSSIAPASAKMAPSAMHSPGLVTRRQSNPQPVTSTGMRMARMSPFPFSPKGSKSNVSSPQSPKRGLQGHCQSSFFFFNQSSGNFVPPLESSCLFSLRYPCALCNFHLLDTQCF